ncbi:MAG: DUF2752 domain-containing protein [Acidobacteria bacterium]|nr:MAG: DUF2752 domain-containing protein [Acidobacteriota bacterium]
MISARAAANCIAAAGLAGASMLLRFSPQEYPFYPRCPFYALTGHYCPGCGATRAIAELLHGHVAAALHFNAAVTLLLPMLLWYFGTMYWAAVLDNRVEWPQVPQWSWRAVLVGVLLFGVARDLALTIF